ncbi:MAG TPA: membrane protein insertase YidC, partial [Burkholderiales bacterium]|nr:membrane protein insertase YidC [Burkholderiales bacterium]
PMDSQRLILFFVFAFSVFMLLDAWQREQQPSKPPAGVVDKEKDKDKATKGAPASAADVPVPSQKLAPAPPVSQPQRAAPVQGGALIEVETDLLVARISSEGGDLRYLRLKKHRDTLDKKKAFVLLDVTPERTYVAQSGLIGSGLPTHRTAYAATAASHQLAEGQDTLEVRLTAPAGGGMEVVKSYRFRRNSYLIDVTFEIGNKGSSQAQPYAYFQLARDGSPPPGDSAMLPTFTGIAVYTEKEKFQKLTFEDVAKAKTPYPKNSNDGWIAILQHYFFSAWLPKNGTPREFYTRKLDDNLYSAGVIVPAGTIAPGERAVVTVPLYVGPEEQEKLSKIAPGLQLTIDYGWLTVIAVPLFWVLEWLYHWVGNWGVAIIILTIIIKALFYPLSAASYRSMAKMRVLAPKLQKLKDQYGDDRQRMQQAMMELYKTEKINPLGGCMPILVQIPVFIALYWVLLASVELRHAPFMLWIDDLAAADPWFILPILMAVTMWVQTLLNPEPPDPVQAKVMKIMPIVFSIFFFFFPAGLVLYWLVNNILSIAQQWRITRVLEREAAGARKS